MAEMRSTQQSESQNSVFDKFLNKKHSLIEFAHHFEWSLECQRYNELVADHETYHKTPDLATPYAVEVQMSKRYTNEVLCMFQEQVQDSLKYGSMVKSMEPPDVHVVGRLGESMKMREVIYDPSNEKIISSYGTLKRIAGLNGASLVERGWSICGALGQGVDDLRSGEDRAIDLLHETLGRDH
ncbi:hypothetical protein QJS04_geneDACA006617 [Acorus gramineus]|uniref:Protein FAR1-RELATED SEQUENCE n=1 Tax=Acorus gramineus TaxID=55184 RepID=A0AAV9A2T7_ACOGR|nr:hypothetical protein QJS04_geneDACA006617 [Acorus gramineus]